MRRIMIAAVVAAVFLFACRRQAPVAPSSETGPARNPGSNHSYEPEKGELMTIEGTLKPTVERGGWILAAEDGEYLLLQLANFRDESWFIEGSRLRAKGRVDRDVLTTFMQGTPFIVSELEPIDGEGTRRKQERHRQ